MGGYVSAKILDQILKEKKREVSALQSTLEKGIGGSRRFPVQTFLDGWIRERGRKIHVIAETKAMSPSRGVIRPDYDPVAIAQDYAAAGASAISVLTDKVFFGGDLNDLSRVRESFSDHSISLPVLRKDFLIDPVQIHEAYQAGADIILLIVRILSRELLGTMIKVSRSVGIEPLVEVHSEKELDVALMSGARLLGVNHRDLDTLQMDLSLSSRLVGQIPDHVVRVAESGLKTARDCQRMVDLGYDGVLVGESFLTATSPGLALKEFLTHVG